mmetsp:Transcript_11335/g.43772  ORF Transcript_11335/g.43772 Transcript_11335/m.43772 type:complete len:202 (+) Transcript_11335:1247-1852(+)
MRRRRAGGQSDVTAASPAVGVIGVGPVGDGMGGGGLGRGRHRQSLQPCLQPVRSAGRASFRGRGFGVAQRGALTGRAPRATRTSCPTRPISLGLGSVRQRRLPLSDSAPLPLPRSHGHARRRSLRVAGSRRCPRWCAARLAATALRREGASASGGTSPRGCLAAHAAGWCGDDGRGRWRSRAGQGRRWHLAAFRDGDGRAA